ncbi:bone morphogenetic protein 4 [Microplitis mediator]|uniref:bone morphogenetic protein 4 n=1 Tax=Microplitis mediator TaxID=375433 RepID=UPI002555F1D3|nr:bone morphogenetic protein 4 [Microplitis mediator]
MGEHPIILSGNRDTDDEDIEDKKKKNSSSNNKIISKSSNSNKRECWSSCEKLVPRRDSPAERSSTRRHPSLVLSLSLGYGNKRARVSISSLLAGFLLVSLLVLSHFRATLAVPTRMEQQQQQDRHQNHHHHQYHHQAESLEAHESTDEGTRDNTEFRDDDDDELETLRRSIVEGLGLKRIPDPSKANVSQTEYERAHGEYLSRLQMSRAPGDRRRKRLHTFHATEVPSRVKRQAVDHHLFFPVEMPVDTMVDHANLRLLLATDFEENPVDVSIYRLTNSSRHLVRRERIKRLSGARWIELDTTETATYWHEGLDDNLGLELRLENPRGGNVLFSDPVFNVFTTSGRGYSRRRRSAPEQLMSLHKGRRTECRGDNKKCCRHEMTVIFKDIKGFEFIVQPKNFDAGYCKGRCPPRYNPAHHHALLQSLIWKEDKRKAPRPCCAPSKLAELEILYFDENDPTKLKVSSWKNMRVLECACS